MRRLWRMLRNPYSGPAFYRLPFGATFSVDAALSNIPIPRVSWCRCTECMWVSFEVGDGHSDPIVGFEVNLRWRP